MTDKLDQLSPASQTVAHLNSQISMTDRHIKKVDVALGNSQRNKVLSLGSSDH